MARYKEIMLQVESVTKQFLNKFVALDNVSLHVNVGEIVSLACRLNISKCTRQFGTSSFGSAQVQLNNEASESTE